MFLIFNQRTSGPVNAHLTPGPGIYFNAFIHVYSPWAGADNPLGTNVDVNRKPLSLCPFVASFKTISTRFFMFFHMYIAPGRGRQTPGVKILMSTERPYHFDHLLQVLKNHIEVWFYTYFLMFSFMYIAPGHKQTNPWGQNFDVNRKLLPLRPFVASLRKNLFEFWFYTHFLMFLHMYIAPGQRQTKFCGQNSDVTKKALSLCPFVASFKTISLKSDFIHIFACFYTCI